MPAELKTTLQNGGIAGQVKAGLDAAVPGGGRRRLLREGRRHHGAAGGPAASRPPEGPAREGTPGGAGQSAGSRGVLAGIRQGLDAQAPAIIQQATQSALTQIKANLDTAADRITGQVTSALKTSFTEAVKRVYFWGLFVIALGFVVTLFLPELALRKTHGHAPAAGEGRRPETGSRPGVRRNGARSPES